MDAIAKGYAVDQALAALVKSGVVGGMVDIGGEITCFGENQPGRDWLLGIQDPFSAQNENQLSEKPGWIVSLRDCAIATSGNYRRYITISGQKYSHIIDPVTGRPAEKLPSVTIIAEKTVDADALATAISVMGPEKGMELIEILANTEAFLIAGSSEKPELYRSSGFAKLDVLP